jgi:nicotinamidase-related amidase
MNAPRTLLDLAGVKAPPARLSESAVVIIDAQREYVDGKLPLEGVDAALAEIGRLLAAARAAQAPVIHIAHRSKPGDDLFDPDGPYYRFAAPAMPIAGETVIDKGLPNAFAGTGLLDAVRATGRNTLILAGFMTHMCISTTARAAIDLGFRNFVVADGTATRALPGPLGSAPISAAAVHRTALAEIADRFATLVAAANVVA